MREGCWLAHWLAQGRVKWLVMSNEAMLNWLAMSDESVWTDYSDMSDEAKLNWLVMRDNCLFRPLYQAFSLYLMYIEKAEKAQVQGYGYMPATF